jgi:hypothetical protein
MNNSTLRGYPIGWAGRTALAVWSLVLLGGFALAHRLEPDPRGYGTHQRLGLPACTLQTLFGVRCPSCGMTTSFAHFTRGRFVEAAGANSAGLLLALGSALGVPWCWASALCGRLLMVVRPDSTLFWTLLIVSGACLLDWLVRLL